MTLWILIGLILLLLVAGFYWFSRGGARRPVFLLEIHIPQSGEPRVTFSPSDAPPDSLIQGLVCYGTKVRWLLNSEPPEILEAFRELMGEALDLWDDRTPALLHNMPTARHLQVQLADTDMAVTGGETFVVRFYRNRRGDGYVINDLPRGLSANIAWHYLVLLDRMHRRLSPELRAAARQALTDWWDAAFSPEGEDSSIRGLRRLMQAANAAYYRAVST